MPPRQNEMREIKPAAPDTVIGNLLTLSSGRILPLPAGHSFTGQMEETDYILVAATQGNLTMTSHQQYTLLDGGQAAAFQGLGEYTIQSVSDSVCMLVRLRGELVGQLLQDRLHEGAAFFPRGAASVRTAVMALSVLEEEYPPVSGDLASSHAYTMLTALRGTPAELEEEQMYASPLVESAIAIIQEEFPFLEGLDELSERLEVSKAHLSRSFVKKTGVSPGKYITHVRIEYAKLLLRDGDASIAYVAEASGFANANYFAKVFRRETGMSPTEYLESAPKRRSPIRGDQRRPVIW